MLASLVVNSSRQNGGAKEHMGTQAEQLRSERDWSAWRPSTPYTIGLEEEVMLLDPENWSLAQRSDDVLPQLPPGLAKHVSAETHQAAIELATDPHTTVRDAITQLRDLRIWLAEELDNLGLAVAAAGTHPSALWTETLVSPAGRYQVIQRTMADLARREPTFALHVHVGVPDAHRAIRLMNQLRAHLPMFLALSANSPFWQGRATGLASTRTSVFGAFPRTGVPRRFISYDDWVHTVDTLLRAGAFPEPTFLWWDVRPQPALGTVEVRVMDAQTDVEATGALCALVQSVARLEIEEGYAPAGLVGAEEVLEENRFLAARDGIEADLLDPEAEMRRPARAQLRRLLDAARPHADALGCRLELERVLALAVAPAFLHQLDVAQRHGGDLPGLTEELAAAFAPSG
jgi:glutamate---cysteine ligase / carboxylate-amine ligase